MSELTTKLRQLDAMIAAGDVLPALDAFFAEDCRFVEVADGATRSGRQAQHDHLSAFFASLKSFNGAMLHSQAAGDDVTHSEWTFDLTLGDGTHAVWNEVLVRKVDGVTYLFASKKNKATFDKNPRKFLPQFGGYCAFGVSVGKKLWRTCRPLRSPSGSATNRKLPFTGRSRTSSVPVPVRTRGPPEPDATYRDYSGGHSRVSLFLCRLPDSSARGSYALMGFIELRWMRSLSTETGDRRPRGVYSSASVCGRARLARPASPLASRAEPVVAAYTEKFDVGALFDRYGAMVYRRALKILGSPSEAEEAMQEVFVRAIRQRGTFRGEAKPSTWLYQVTTNYCLNQLRNQRRRDELRAEQPAPRISDPPRADALMTARRLIADADERCAKAALLVYVDGMTHNEASKHLGVSRRSVGNLLDRFTRSAREQLEESDVA